EVAKANNVRFVDLFNPTKVLFELAPKSAPFTINGIHLTDLGNRKLAQMIDSALFGKTPDYDEKALQKLRQAVRDKNFYWFNRYRVLDGYNVYGGRAFVLY